MYRFLTNHRPLICVFVVLATLLLAAPGQAQDAPDTSNMLPAAPSALPDGWTVINQDDGYTKWRLDVNSACIFTDHKYSLNLPEDPARMSDIRLTMSNHDVDYFDPQDCEGGPEFDNADLNGQTLGILAGANEQWSVNSWVLTRERLHKGANSIFIDTDATGTGCWCVAVGYIELQAKVGFHILETTPVSNDYNRDFHAAGLDLTVTFSGDLNPATVTKDTFILHTRNSAGQPQVVNGTFSFPAPNKLLFTPSTDLLDGVRYYATVIGGPNGVKNKDNVPLDLTRTWNFWTVPNLDRSDSFDFGDGLGSRCPPSASPCSGLEIAVFQVARNATMIPNKDSVARLYLRWKRHSGIHPDDLLKELSVNVTLDVTPGGGSYSTVQTVKRPDLYTQAQIASAANTINIYHKPPSGFTYSARIIPQPQTNATTIVFNAARALANLGKSPIITFHHYFLKDGLWSSGVPNEIKTGAASYLAEGALRTLDMFPAVAVNPVIKGDITIGYTYTGNNVSYGSCGTVKEVLCRVGAVDVAMPEAQCVHQKLSTMLGGNKIVSISVPQNVCTNSGGVAIGRVLMLVPTNNPVVVPHEVGHAYDISTANNPNPGHRNNPAGIEGFQVRTRVNRSRVENPAAAESLMHTGPIASPNSQWTHNDDYTTLLGTVTAVQAAAAQAGSYLVIAGVVDVDANSVEVEPLTLQATPIEPDGTGVCHVELLDGANAVLSSASFTPGVEVHTFLTSNLSQDNAYSPQTPYQDGPQPFALTLPWNESAQTLQISCGGPPLFTQSRSAATPTVDFTDLAEGATLSGNVTLNWTGSDGDSAALFYQLEFSDDNGATWSSLTPATEASTYSLDTSLLPSGSDHKLRLLVTDGFNSAFAERTVTLANPFMVIAKVPADFSDSIELGTSMQAVFNTPVDPSTLSVDSFTITGPGEPMTVTGNLTLSEDGRTVTFQPAALLEPDRYYTVRVHDTLRDITGSTLPFDDAWSFRTITDTVPPQIEFISPSEGELNVPINAFISVHFNEPLNFGVAQANFSLTDEQGQPVEGFTSTYESERILLFDPQEDLKSNTLYRATVSTGITDQNHNALEQARVWNFTTGTGEAPQAHIIGNYDERVEDVDGDGLYDTLTIFVDVQSLSGPYFLNARLIDGAGELIQWTSAKFGDDGLIPNLLDQGVHRLALTFDASTIRTHQVDGPYFLDSLSFYGGFFNTSGEGDHRYRVYQTLPYSVTEFAGVLSFRPLPDRRLEWNTTIEDAWNLRDYTFSLDTPPDEVTYSIIDNTDPGVGVSIDANDFIDIKPAPGVEAESTVTVEARDSAGNRAQASFQVYVQKPQATFLIFPPTLVLLTNQEQEIVVEIEDQFEQLFTGEAVTVTISNELETATVSAESVTTSTGRATFTYSPGAVSGTDILLIDAGPGLSARIEVVIGEGIIFIPSIHYSPTNTP